MEYIGIDIGGTKCAVVKGNEERGVYQKERFDTLTKDETIKLIYESVERLMPADAIGISCGGPLDEKKGVILSPPNLPGWDEVEIKSMLEEKFGVPVKLCNDANACALAEWKFGAGRGSENMVFLTFGTGLGAGIIMDSRLISGQNGNAGEVGHISLADDGPVGYGKAGSFEGFCSGGGIAKLGKMKASEALSLGKPFAFGKSAEEIEKITTKSLAEYAKAGDGDAAAIFEISARRLGEGLSIIVDILNPEVIVIGSVFARCEELFRPTMERVMRERALGTSLSVCRVVPAQLGESIGDVAALAVAIESLK